MSLLRKIKNTFSSKKVSESGFSLFELLVAMIIFLIVTTAIYGLLNMGRVSRNRSSRRTDVLKNARAAIHLIGRDALNAGLGFHQAGAIVPDDFLSDTLGLPEDTDTERDILTSVIAGDNLFSNDLLDNSTDKTDIIAFAYRDLEFRNGNPITLRNVLDYNSEPTWVRLRSRNNHADAASKYDLCLIESDSTQVAIMVSDVIDHRTMDVKPGDPLGLNQAKDGSGNDGSLLKKCTASVTENCTNYLASMKRFYWVSYKVQQDGTLVRKVYGNNTGKPFDEQIQIQPLAYNVKDLQFSYLLADGTVTSTPSAGPDGIVGTTDDKPNDFNLIRQITVKIQVQSTESDEQTGEPEVIKLEGSFSVRNLQYDIG